MISKSFACSLRSQEPGTGVIEAFIYGWSEFQLSSQGRSTLLALIRSEVTSSNSSFARSKEWMSNQEGIGRPAPTQEVTMQ